MSNSLPVPGHLVVENINLLAGSPDAFQNRYGHQLTATTFVKPGNTVVANAVLHYLITIIDGEVAESLFKPCFPILDREQERDFRKVVDARLSVLEKTKLIPVGAARKSVISSGGGDRFIDLLWSLSSLAVQQACLRHPAYGPVSRLRLVSQQVRSDSFTSQSSTRSSRSFRVGRGSRHDRSSRPPRPEPSRQRRFLGPGMVHPSQQRAKDAEEMRARIDAERATLARTTQMGAQGTMRWDSEAASLREKIGDYETKLQRMKGQLADMGFDENGVDVRASQPPETTPEVVNTPTSHPVNKVAAIQNSVFQSLSSRVDLAEELKTSPIESTESCSSIDESMERVTGEIAADLNQLLTLEAETRTVRSGADLSMTSTKLLDPSGTAQNDYIPSLPSLQGKGETTCDVVELVRAATNELEQATSCMTELEKRREQSKTESLSSEDSENIDSKDTDLVPETNSGNDLREQEGAAKVKEEENVSVNSPCADVAKIPQTPISVKVAKEVSNDCEPVDTHSEDSFTSCAEGDKNLPEGHVNKVNAFPKEEESNVIDSCPTQPQETANPLSSCDREEVTSPKENEENSSLEESEQLTEEVSQVLLQHTELIEATDKLCQSADKAVEEASPESSDEVEQSFNDNTAQAGTSTGVTDAEWIEVCQKLLDEAPTGGDSQYDDAHDSSDDFIGSMNELDVVFRSLPMKVKNVDGKYISSSRNALSPGRSMDSLMLDVVSEQAKTSSSEGNTPDSTTASNSASKMRRGVRFAELPPSYSASRSCDDLAGKAAGKDTKFPSDTSSRSSRRQNRSEVSEEARTSSECIATTAVQKSTTSEADSTCAGDVANSMQKGSLQGKELKSKREGRRVKTKGKSDEVAQALKMQRPQRPSKQSRPVHITDVVAPHPAAPNATKAKQCKTTSPTPVSPPRRKTGRTVRSYPPAGESTDVQPAAARRTTVRTTAVRSGVRSVPHVPKEYAVVHSLSPSLQSEAPPMVRRINSTPVESDSKKEVALSINDAKPSDTKAEEQELPSENVEQAQVEEVKDTHDDSKLVMAFTALNNSSMAMGSDAESEALHSISAKAPEEEPQPESGEDSENKLVVTAQDSTLSETKLQPIMSTLGKGNGFFVGHTPQWQQSTRSASLVSNQTAERSTTRAGAISGGLFSRKSGRVNPQSPSTRKSKMQALRARLAALK